MNEECVKSLVKNVDARLIEIVNNLICSICQELFNKPVTTPCGHSFCNGCIKRVLSSKSNSGCPLCKNPVKRYGLVTAQVKTKFSDICKELPFAFEQDVKDFSKDMLDLGEELIKSSKLSQLNNQEWVKESKTSRQKFTGIKRSKKIIDIMQCGNDSESSCPVLKRGKYVQKYVSAKNKRIEDLVSISQTEPTSHSGFCESFEVNKKLEKIEKIPPEEKINEWFNAVGDNIFISSPDFSLEVNSKNECDSEKKVEKPTMIRRDYNKSNIISKNETGASKTMNDPYEFVCSQPNKKGFKTKRQKRSSGKKIPDFKAIQSFSKESIKRNTILLDNSKEEFDHEEETKELLEENRISASQKFDKLLLETKEESKKPHALYSSSQSSSQKFLDLSFKSKVDSPKISNAPTARIKLVDEEELLFKDMRVFPEEKRGRSGLRQKRKKSSEAVCRGKKQKLFSDIKYNETQSEEDVKSCVTKDPDKYDFYPTKLEELLKELVDDDIIYATRPSNAPVRLPEIIRKPGNQQADVPVSQNTELIGFCTQEECPNEKNFKQLVDSMEKELNSIEHFIEDPKPTDHCNFSSVKSRTIDSSLNEDENGNCKSKMCQKSCIEFLHLGKLTPIRKRAKSTVVKVVFPIGLSSLARRHILQTSFTPPIQALRKQTRQVSTGIQTSLEQPVSCLVQTSQVVQSSTAIQTSQKLRSSVEIQTTQKCNASTEVQTSQRLVCQEIQTTQIEYDSAQVQTTQLAVSQLTDPQSIQTPLRKPSHQHRKIIKRKKLNKSDSQFPISSSEKPLPVEKEVMIDFDLEEEFDRTWQRTQKQDQFVKMKNQKNKEHNEKASVSQRKLDDLDSDDSDIIPRRGRNSLRILSEDSVGILEDGMEVMPLDVKRVNSEAEMEVIQLDTPQTENSEEQMMRVLKNIDLDMPKAKNVTKGEKSEESDSDFFVEQTPPRPSSRAVDDRNLSKSRIGADFMQKISPRENFQNENLDGIDLIGDSLSKGFSDSFFMTTAPKKMTMTPEKNSKDEVQKLNLKIQPTIDLPNENDQNQMNAFEDKRSQEAEAKAFKLKAVVDSWKRTDAPSPLKVPPHKKLCILASSVKNPELIKKFTSKFKAEYLSKPTKDMTHLIVGLHENEEKEVLPLCTPKLLFAMANKKWVVNELWAESCLKANMILPEETFETLDPVGGQGCRNSRISSEKLLKNCEIFLLGEFQMISKEEFAELIVDSGGTLVSAPERFSILPSKLRMIIADRDCLKFNEKQLLDLYRKYSAVILSRDVIIMAIQSHRLPNFSPYYLHQVSEESLIKLGYPSPLVRNEEEEEDD